MVVVVVVLIKAVNQLPFYALECSSPNFSTCLVLLIHIYKIWEPLAKQFGCSKTSYFLHDFI